ncbi:hypothetical protein niasHT_031159 [Heterodera trifolii]|uniref:Uncharacterized protein n=1 Tax=Heterodera trifolii TaxID=157864 RepID=A0ABD2I6Y8_9BILA
MSGAEAMNIAANHFIFLLTARHFDYEIAVHFKNVKKIENSMAETILPRFEIVDQSNKSKERPSICKESFVIDITATESVMLRKKLAGKGRINNFEVPYNISDGATYNLANNDSFCLFRAFEWLRMKYVLQQQLFSEYKRDDRRQLIGIADMCQACGINMSLPFYSIEEHGERTGERIQAYYDHHHPGMFRLFCFGTFGKMKPLWKSEVAVYKQELCVLFNEGEDGMDNQATTTQSNQLGKCSRYDHVLIFGEMLRMGVRPNLVRQGNHLLEMKAHKKGAITTTIFRDSYKLIPLKLASFVKTFGLNIDGVENKKYFPHKFNKAVNYGRVLDTLPPLEDFRQAATSQRSG